MNNLTGFEIAKILFLPFIASAGVEIKNNSNLPEYITNTTRRFESQKAIELLKQGVINKNFFVTASNLQWEKFNTRIDDKKIRELVECGVLSVFEFSSWCDQTFADYKAKINHKPTFELAKNGMSSFETIFQHQDGLQI